jgi:hypothetical protein
MNPTTMKQAIRHAFYRLGLHTRPKAVVHALAQQGIQVGEELVRQVQVELLKETTDGRHSKATRPVPSPGVRRRPQGFPGRNRG